jgi:Tol biopolymer transport system component
VMPATGGRGRTVATHVGGCTAPAWSPDSTRIAFSGGLRLSVVDVATAAVVRTPSSFGQTGAFAWTQDGAALYATSRPPASERAGDNCLSLVRLDAATLRGPVVVRGCG